MTKTKNRFLTVGLAVIVLLAAALFVIPSLGTTANAEAWDGTTIASDFAGGSGTETDPYQIANGEQLAYLAHQVNEGESSSGEYFKLTADIDLGSKEWTPIGSSGSFVSTFDGNGKIISNFKPTVYNGYTGLFGSNGGTIRNVYLDSVDVVYTEGYGAAALCAENGTDGIIEGCAVLGGRIDASSTDASGVAAGVCAINNGKINKCYNMAAVTTNTIGAGIVYYNGSDGTVSNCYNAGEVSGTSDESGEIGGICSENYGKIEYCLNYGEVKNAKTVGGICAANYNGQSSSTSEYSTINSCYSDSNVCSAEPIGKNGGGRESDVGKKATEELCSYNFWYNSGFGSEWQPGIYEGRNASSTPNRLGELTVRYPVLKDVSKDVTSKVYNAYNFKTDGADNDWQRYTLITTEDEFRAIGKDESKWHENYVLGADLDLTGKDVTPIGNITAFDGKFSGDGHTISGVKISVTGNDPAGLFGGSTGVIMNLAVKGEISGNNAVGGICGQSNGTIYACSFNGTVTGTGTNVGGICGYNYKNIVNCFSAAGVMGSDQVGGICGYNASNATVSDTVSVCTVSGTGNLVAAVCGKNDGTLTDNYFDKDVSGITVGAKDGDNNELSDGTIGWTTEELCTIMPGIDYTIWSDGSKITEVDKNNARKRTVTYTYPSLKAVGKAHSADGIFQYNFGIDGTDDWQEYTEINSADDLKKINEDLYGYLNGNYVLMNDIDIKNEPIDNYLVYVLKGKFSGDGHTISGVNISSDDESDYTGLFGANYGTIMYLAVKGNVTGVTAGGICGRNGADADEGTFRGIIYSCSFEGTVTGTNHAGGICGANEYNGKISSCYAIADVIGAAKFTDLGGIAGLTGWSGALTGENTLIEYCYFAGTLIGELSGNSAVGAIYGNYGSKNNGKDIVNCYYNSDLCDKNNEGGVSALTTKDFCKIAPSGAFEYGEYVALPHSDNDRIRTVKYKYPSLVIGCAAYERNDIKQYNFKTNGDNDDWQEYTEITSADDLAKINDNLGGSYVLMNDITLGDFTIIGSQDAPFTGKFSGNGHKITAKNAGIFGFNEGTIMNLAVEGDITGSGNNVGGICGYNNGTVYACSFKGSVKGKTYVGGICGYNNSTISNCYAIGSVEATEDYAGGICGKNQAGIKIEYCYFAGMPMSTDHTEAICYGGSQYCYYDRELYYVSDSDLGNSTTEKLCNSSLPEYLNRDIWEAGSFTVTSTDGKFRTVSYKYPRLKEGCKAYKVDDVKQYNFKTDGKDYWAQFKEIKTLADLENVDNNTNANYVMMNDIDLDGAEFTPISINFGKFSGDGHTIKNGKIVSTRNYGDYTGLFKDNRGFIMNLAVKCDVSGRNVVGAFCGFNYGTIYGCSFEGSVTGNEQVGGICGYMSGGESHIINCYVIGTIKATNTLAGGISGSTRGAEDNGYWDFAPPSIKNCYLVGTVTVPDSGKKDAITVKTSADTYLLTVTNCYYNSDLYTEDDSKGTGFTTVEMTSSDALSKMSGLSGSVWEKTANKLVDSDGENGVAYYPSLIGSTYVPSVEYTADMKFERTDNRVIHYAEGFDVAYGCTIKFANGAEKQLDSTEITYTVSDSTGNISDYTLGNTSKVLMTYAAGDVTYTLTCKPNGAALELLPANGTAKDLVVNIGKQDPISFLEFKKPSSLVFDGSVKQASVNVYNHFTGIGEITVKYFDSNGDETEPIDVGEYTVKADIAEGDNFLAAENLTDSSWKFEITKAPAPVIADNSVSTSWIAKNKSIPAAGLPERMGEVSVTAVISGADIIAADSARYSDGEFFFTIGANKESYIGKTADITFTFTTQNYNDFTYTVKVTLTEKGDQNVPDSNDFNLVFINHGTDIMAKIVTDLEGVEFSFNGTDWNAEGTTSSSNHNTIVTAYIRFAETDELNASPAASKTANSGHGDMVHHERVEPTCTDVGNVEYWECELCGEYFLDENGKISTTLEDTVLAMVPHKPSEAVRENEVPATCTVDGSYDEVVYCSVCDEELSRTPKTIPATGHDWATEWSTDEHDHWYKCGNCDEIKDKAAHVSSGAATETTPETCTVCGYVIAPELGHIHTNHLTEVPAKAATCIEDGNKQYYKCDCGKLFTDSAAATETTLADVTIKAEGHKFGDWVTTKQPTYTSTGIKTRTCSVCGATEEDTIPKKTGGSSGGSSGGSAGGGSSRPSTPAETKPAINGSQKSWADISSDVAQLPAGGSATISMNGETNIPVDVIRSIKDSKAKVEFVIDSTRSWIIDGSKITAASAADFSILPGNADRSGLRGTPGANLKISGTGVPADLKLTFRKEFAGQFANVYKLTDGKLQFQGCIKVDENGAAVVSDAYTKGQYVVMVCKFSDRSGDMNNDGVLNALDAAAVLKDIVGIADGENPLMGDYNGDGIVNALDAAAILKAIVGIAA